MKLYFKFKRLVCSRKTIYVELYTKITGYIYIPADIGDLYGTFEIKKIG